MLSQMDQQLTDLARYEALVDELVRKTKNKPYLLYRDASLRWIISNRKKTARLIVEFLKNPEGFQLSQFKKQNIFLDKKRVTFNTEWPEKTILMNLGKIIAQYTDDLLSPNLFSYRKKRGPHLAIKQLLAYLRQHRQEKKLFVFKTDIDDYTNSMDKQTLLSTVEAVTPIAKNPLCHDIFKQLMDFSYVENGQLSSTKGMPVGVPIGIPLVPLLNNLYLMSLDSEMAKLPNIFYARYGDDVMIISPDYHDYHHAIDTAARILQEKRVRMKTRKTFHIHYTYQSHAEIPQSEEMQLARRMEWLGFSIFADGKVGPKRDTYGELVSKVKGEMYRLIKMAKTYSPERSQQIAFLRQNMRPFWANPNIQYVARKFSGVINPELFEQLDQYFAHYFTRKVARVWNTNKREAWQVYQSAEIPSLKTANQWEHYDWVA